LSLLVLKPLNHEKAVIEYNKQMTESERVSTTTTMWINDGKKATSVRVLETRLSVLEKDKHQCNTVQESVLLQ